MKKVKYLSLAVIVLLSCYLLTTALFVRVFETTSQVRYPTRTPASTFTPVPTEPVKVVAPLSSAATPTTMPSPTLLPAPTDTALPTATPLPSATPTPYPQVVAAGGVNVRTGPGTAYPVIGALLANDPATVVGQNTDGSWWQIELDVGGTGWVADWVVQASQTESVPVAAAPPPPPPTPTIPPPPPEKPAHQYEPTGWFSDTNYGLTRFLGAITDAQGNPVNGVYVEASCGSFRVLSNASGTTGWPPGFYDITLDRKPLPCDWGLAVVASEDGKTAAGRLSELQTIKVTVDESIVTANWRKNW